jgi:hypothetical protein
VLDHPTCTTFLHCPKQDSFFDSHSQHPHSRPLRPLSIPRKLLQLSIIDLLQLRASQLTHKTAQQVREPRQGSKERIRLGLGRELENEAAQIVLLEQTRRVEQPAGEVAEIDSREGVWRAGVAAKQNSSVTKHTAAWQCKVGIFRLSLPSNVEEFRVLRARV